MLHLHPKFAPTQVGVYPLVKKDGMPERARSRPLQASGVPPTRTEFPASRPALSRDPRATFPARYSTRRGLRRRLAPIRLRLKRPLKRHLNSPVPSARKIAKDLREYGAALWTFARVEGIEPTNNAAERAVRKAILWRKTSFGSASRWGSRFAERMLTVCESLRAQGRSILELLVGAIRARLMGAPQPSLLPP